MTSLRRRITACLAPAHNPHLAALSIKTWDITWFVAFTAGAHTHTHTHTHMRWLCFGFDSQPYSFLLLYLLLTFFSSSVCLARPVCPCRLLSVCVCVCLTFCVCSQIEKRGRKACETPEFLWLRPSFLPSSLFPFSPQTALDLTLE